MFNDTITLFNKYEDKKQKICRWYSKVLDNVELQKNKAVSVSKDGTQTADAVKLHINYSSNGIEVLDGIYQYLKPKEWSRSEDKRNTLTLKAGDFFVEGELEIGEFEDGDYQGGLFQYMRTEYDDVYVISSVDTYKMIPHFEVGGN